MRQDIETVIIGGGQAGLATSYFLSQHGHEHVVLEKSARAGNAWRNDRWDSFCLLTPNWSFRLPGSEYYGPDPDGFLPKAEIVATFERYVERFHLPVQYRVEVAFVEPLENSDRYRVQTEQVSLYARNVVVATGLFQAPRIPAYASGIDPAILQLHSGQYRNPQALPPGAVLVVGSGQSGCQIAEELNQAGRTVYLSTGSAGHVPRRYRGKDIYEWQLLSGFLDRTPDQLPSPQARFAANPQITGKNGGHDLNVHRFYRDGIRLLGHLQSGEGEVVYAAPDLAENLAKMDRFEAEIIRMVDNFIARAEMTVPVESLPSLRDAYDAPEVTELNLASAGVSTIIWAGGYRFDFGLVRLPVFDEFGFPLQKRGITASPGLYFVGLPWLHRMKSGFLVGFGEDAEFVARDILRRSGHL